MWFFNKLDVRLLGMRGIPVPEKYRYLLYFKRYDIRIDLITVFHMLLLRSSPVVLPKLLCNRGLNVTTELRDGSNRLNSINAPEINK